jgi:TIR domain
MRIFLSWSGARSAALAHALREWLPTVIQAVEPWMSESDIDRGARWSSDIAVQLEEAHVGIICLTPDNVSSPSLHFEAGALSKALDKSFVCTYLLDLEPTDLRWPLATFQATRVNKEETKQLLMTINKALGEQALPSERLDKTFERWWPELAAQIKKAPSSDNTASSSRPDRELLEEILELLRNRRIEEEARQSTTALRTAAQQLRAIEAELAELRSRHAAVVEASEADSGGQVELGLRRERERLETAIREALARVESARASIVREK